MKRDVIVRAVVLVSAGVSVVLYLTGIVPRLATTEVDDAYMFLRYAKHFIAGAGFSWNVSDGPAYGATSPLYLLLVTVVRRFTQLPDPEVLTASSLGAGLAACAVLAALGFVVLEGTARRLWMPLLVVPTLLLSSLFTNHSVSGMETTLSFLCNALLATTIVLYLRCRSTFHFALCLAAAYVTVQARPDNGLYAVLLPPLFFIASERHLAKRAALFAGLLVGLLALDLLAKRALFGSAIPLPFYVKSGGAYIGYLGAYRWNAADYMVRFVTACLPYFLVMALFLRARALPQVLAILLPVALTFAYYATVQQVMGTDARYYYPSLPFVVLAAFVTVRESLQDAAAELFKPRHRAAVRVLCMAMLVLVTQPPAHDLAARLWWEHFIGEPTRYDATRVYATDARTPLPQFEWWDNILKMTRLLQQMPRGIVVAASEYGYVGAELPDITIVDLVGLHDRRVAREDLSADYVFSRRPDMVWFPHSEYSYATKEILDSQVFAEQYDYYPGAYDYGIAINRGSARYPAIMSVLEQEFSRVYGARPVPHR